MNIGYGSISSYDSVRYDLFFDETLNSAYFEGVDRKYIVKLNYVHVAHIKQNKKLWITLSNLPPKHISSKTVFTEKDFEICLM
jgi:hypothetical protein